MGELINGNYAIQLLTGAFLKEGYPCFTEDDEYAISWTEKPESARLFTSLKSAKRYGMFLEVSPFSTQVDLRNEVVEITQQKILHQRNSFLKEKLKGN